MTRLEQLEKDAKEIKAKLAEIEKYIDKRKNKSKVTETQVQSSESL